MYLFLEGYIVQWHSEMIVLGFNKVFYILGMNGSGTSTNFQSIYLYVSLQFS